MSDPIVNASNLTAIARQLPKVPKPLADAIANFNALTGLTPPDNFPDLDKLDAKSDYSKIIACYAATLAARESWGQAYSAVRQRLAQKVINAAKASAEDIIDSVQPLFVEAAERFTTAAQNVPAKCDSDSLVSAGPQALSAFYEALDAQNELVAFENLVKNINTNAGFGYDLGYWAIVTPVNRAAAQQFIHQEEVGGGIRADLLFAAKNPDLFTLELSHPHDIALTTQQLNEQDVVTNNPTLRSLR